MVLLVAHIPRGHLMVIIYGRRGGQPQQQVAYCPSKPSYIACCLVFLFCSLLLPMLVQDRSVHCSSFGWLLRFANDISLLFAPGGSLLIRWTCVTLTNKVTLNVLQAACRWYLHGLQFVPSQQSSSTNGRKKRKEENWILITAYLSYHKLGDQSNLYDASLPM